MISLPIDLTLAGNTLLRDLGFARIVEAVQGAAGEDLGRRLMVVFVYMLLAKLADFFIDHLIKRIVHRTRIDLDERFVDFIHRPLCLSIVILGLLHALVIPPPLDPPWNTVLPNAVRTLLLILWFGAVVIRISNLDPGRLRGVLNRHGIDWDLFLMLRNVSRVIIIFTAILWGLIIWKVDLTPLFASAGIAGIAIALAAKDTLANFFGGLSMFADRAFKVGDYIVLESGERGEVIDVGIRSTKIRTRDDVMITIPNAIMASSKIVNQSAPRASFRIRLDISVSYDSDLRMVEKTLVEVAKANGALASNPEPRARVRAFEDSGIRFQLLAWVKAAANKGRETHNLYKAIHRTFRDRGIEIPFPQQDLHLRTIRALEAVGAPEEGPDPAGQGSAGDGDGDAREGRAPALGPGRLPGGAAARQGDGAAAKEKQGA